MYNESTGSGPLSWSPTTAFFFNKNNGLGSARFSTFGKRSGNHVDSPATPSLFATSDGHSGSGSNSSLGFQSLSSQGNGSELGNNGEHWSPHNYWSTLSSDSKAGITSTSATFPNDPNWEQSQSSRTGGEGHANGSLHQGHGQGHGPLLYQGSFSPANGGGRNGMNGMVPPTPRGMAPPPPLISSRNPRSAGLSWLYQDLPMGSADATRQASMPQGQHHSEMSHSLNAFAVPLTTLSRPPLSARAPRSRRGTAHEESDVRTTPAWATSVERSISPGEGHSAGSDGAELSHRSYTTTTFFTPDDGRYASEEARWAAVQAREPRASAAFFYCVLTTKVRESVASRRIHTTSRSADLRANAFIPLHQIFCRTTCPSRRPVRENICFVNTAQEASALGYRACKRCKPDVQGGDPHEERQEVLINKVKDRLLQSIIEGGKGKAVKGKGLKYIAEELGVSHWHLHRCFKKRVGTTPEAWAKAQAKRLRSLRRSSGGGASEVSYDGERMPMRGEIGHEP